MEKRVVAYKFKLIRNDVSFFGTKKKEIVSGQIKLP